MALSKASKIILKCHQETQLVLVGKIFIIYKPEMSTQVLDTQESSY